MATEAHDDASAAALLDDEEDEAPADTAQAADGDEDAVLQEATEADATVVDGNGSSVTEQDGDAVAQAEAVSGAGAGNSAAGAYVEAVRLYGLPAEFTNEDVATFLSDNGGTTGVSASDVVGQVSRRCVLSPSTGVGCILPHVLCLAQWCCLGWSAHQCRCDSCPS